jgi:hypothetical protein
MKKLIILSIFGLSILSVQSCKKSYSCECEGYETDLNYGKIKKSEVDAIKNECESDTTKVCKFVQK